MTNNSKFTQLLDYLKESFNLLVKNKQILMPIIFFILSRTAVAMIFVLSLLPTISNLNEILKMIDTSRGAFAPELRPVLSQLTGLPLVAFIVLIIISTFGFTMLEAKLYINYAKIIPKTPSQGKGLVRTFLAFLVANIIIMLSWIIIAIPYVLIGFLTLSLGFAVIPFLIDILLLYYKGIYVVSDKNIFSSLSESIRFAWKNIVISAILQLVILVSDLGNLMRKSSYYSQNLNGFLKYESQNTDQYVEEYVDKINSFLPEDAKFLGKVLDIVQSILIPVSFLLIISMAIVFVIKQVINAYLSLSATYVYCEITRQDEYLENSMEELENEYI